MVDPEVTDFQRHELCRMIGKLGPVQLAWLFAVVMALISKSPGPGIRVTFEALPL
jgi:hypothetical protein